MAWKYVNGKLVEVDAEGNTKQSTTIDSSWINSLDINGNNGIFGGSGTDGLKITGARGTPEQLAKALNYFLRTGEEPPQGYLGAKDNQYDNVLEDMYKIMEYHEIDHENYVGGNNDGPVVDPITGSKDDARDAALNTYYKDLYSHDVEGTGGNMLKRDLEGRYQREANLGAEMANIQFQDAAMNQAQIVKQITDQVRSERMARLKSGMSAAQIANQDMQSMMANVNALNENQRMLGDQRIAANMAQRGAKDIAFDAYLQEANTRGQNAAAYSAADAANIDFMAQQYMRNNPGTSYKKAVEVMSGNTGQ